MNDSAADMRRELKKLKALREEALEFLERAPDNIARLEKNIENIRTTIASQDDKFRSIDGRIAYLERRLGTRNALEGLARRKAKAEAELRDLRRERKRLLKGGG